MQRIQDEVHRFAITFLRQQREKQVIQSVLDNIEGVGPKRKQQLLQHFGSIKKIKAADEQALREAGMTEKLATTIYAFFRQ